MLPIPIFIGISERFRSVQGITACSILENTQADVDIRHLYPDVEAGCTGFSNVRYQIRRGIYLDCDMIVLGDIAELWHYRRPGKFVCMRDGSTEVAVIDCEHKCTNKREESKLPKSCDIPPVWNTTDAYRENGQVVYRDGVPENTKLFHFTALDTQPWFYEHPNRKAVELYEYYSKPYP